MNLPPRRFDKNIYAFQTFSNRFPILCVWQQVRKDVLTYSETEYAVGGEMSVNFFVQTILQNFGKVGG